PIFEGMDRLESMMNDAAGDQRIELSAIFHKGDQLLHKRWHVHAIRRKISGFSFIRAILTDPYFVLPEGSGKLLTPPRAPQESLMHLPYHELAETVLFESSKPFVHRSFIVHDLLRFISHFISLFGEAKLVRVLNGGLRSFKLRT